METEHSLQAILLSWGRISTIIIVDFRPRFRDLHEQEFVNPQTGQFGVFFESTVDCRVAKGNTSFAVSREATFTTPNVKSVSFAGHVQALVNQPSG